MVFQYGAMDFFCLVETKRGGVINLLPDNLSEIGVEYVEVSYSLHCSLNYVFLFLFFFVFLYRYGAGF